MEVTDAALYQPFGAADASIDSLDLAAVAAPSVPSWIKLGPTMAWVDSALISPAVANAPASALSLLRPQRLQIDLLLDKLGRAAQPPEQGRQVAQLVMMNAGDADGQRAIVHAALDRWLNPLTNYAALDALASNVLDDAQAGPLVAQVLEDRIVQLFSSLHGTRLSYAAPQLAALAINAINAAGNEGGRRALLEHLGPENVSKLVLVLGPDLSARNDATPVAYGSAPDISMRMTAMTQLLEAIGQGELTATSSRFVQAAAQASAPEAYTLFGGYAAAMNQVLASFNQSVSTARTLGVSRPGFADPNQNCMAYALCDSRDWQAGGERTKDDPWPEETYLRNKGCHQIECNDSCDSSDNELKLKLYEWTYAGMYANDFHMARQNADGTWSAKLGYARIYDFPDPDKHITKAYGGVLQNWRATCWCCQCNE